MTYIEGIDFIVLHGNCTRNKTELLNTQPTMQQLDNAIHYAIVTGQPKELAESARDAIIKHYEDLQRQLLLEAGIEDV